MSRTLRLSKVALAGAISAFVTACASSTHQESVGLDVGCEVAKEVRAAFLYGYGVYEYTRTTVELTGNEASRFNRLEHRSDLSGPESRTVTSPNNDVLISTAFLDLSGGPVQIIMPRVHDRYHSVAFMDSFTDNIAYLGTRATGGNAGTFWIVGPSWDGVVPDGVQLLRSDTNDVWMLGRTLVAGPDDLLAAREVQAQISISEVPGYGKAGPLKTVPVRVPNASMFLNVVNEMLGRSQTDVGQARRAKQFASCGIQPGETDVWKSLPPSVREIWTSELPLALSDLRRGSGKNLVQSGAWRSAPRNVGAYGNDDELRARIALSGLAALSAQEATYFVTAHDKNGDKLDGNSTYEFKVPSGGVPVDAFWSLTMYSEDADGRLYLVENPISRYSISDRTPQIVRAKDGSIAFYLQRTIPEGNAANNWLPTPEGPFSLSFRAYLPHAEILNGEWVPVPVEPVVSE